MNLLERAKSRFRGDVEKELTNEELELVRSWLNFEVGSSDVAFALYDDSKKATSAVLWIAQRMRDAIKAKRLSISIIGGSDDDRVS